MLFHVYLTYLITSLNFCHGPPELKHDYLRLLLWNIVFGAFKSVVSQEYNDIWKLEVQDFSVNKCKSR